MNDTEQETVEEEREVEAPFEVRKGLIARNTLINFVGQLLPLVAAVVAIPLVVRGLGTDRFGLLGIAWMALYYFGELGFHRATTKFVADSLGRADRHLFVALTWTTVGFQAVLGAALGVGLALVSGFLTEGVLQVPENLAEEARTAFLVLAAVLPAVLVGGAFRGVLEAAQRFDIINLVRVPVSAANFLLPLLGLAIGWQLPGILALLLLSRLIMMLAFATASLWLFPALRVPALLEWSDVKRVLGYGGWVSVSGVVSPILVHLDRFMLGALAPIGAVGFYTAAYELVARMWIIPTSLVATLFPALSTFAARGEIRRLAAVTSESVKYVLLVLGPVVLLLLGLGRDLLSLWLVSEFAIRSTLAMQILAAGVLVNSLAYVPFTLLQGVGRPDVPAKFHLLELPVQVLAVLVFIRLWGIPGAALAWTFRVCLDAALLFWAGTRSASIPSQAYVDARVPQTVLLLSAASLAAILASTSGNLAFRAGWTSLIVGAVLMVGWRYALGEGDRSRFRQLIMAGVGR